MNDSSEHRHPQPADVDNHQHHTTPFGNSPGGSLARFGVGSARGGSCSGSVGAQVALADDAEGPASRVGASGFWAIKALLFVFVTNAFPDWIVPQWRALGTEMVKIMDLGITENEKAGFGSVKLCHDDTCNLRARHAEHI